MSSLNHIPSTQKPANILAVKSISISYPPLKSQKGTAFLSQNRQFQWTNTGNVIYPVILASAASLLQKKGYQVFWDDAIAQKITYKQWFSNIIKNKPDIVVIETKTPVIKRHWKIINELKTKSLEFKKWKLKIVLIGDHVTALPQESIKNCLVDYILIGGDYDFLLLELIEKINSNNKPKNKIFKSNSQHLLDELPIIDRQLTQWHLYSQNNTNFRYKPGAYIMSGRDCWWGRCTFCSWTTLFPGKCFRSFSVKHTISEIENLVNNFGVKEIFDDSGSLPTGLWLTELCHQLIKKKLNQKVKIGCNMRFGALTSKEYQLMYQAGFRFVLYGLESANQKTLDFINKNETTKDALATLKIAKKNKLQPHITIMVGFPNETELDIQNTLKLSKKIFQLGLADSLQATLLIPYPGTPLFKFCQKNNLLLTKDWDKFDMRQPVIKTVLNPKQINFYIQEFFKSIFTPRFIIYKITSIKSIDDIKFLLFYGLKFLKKLKDFQ